MFLVIKVFIAQGCNILRYTYISKYVMTLQCIADRAQSFNNIFVPPVPYMCFDRFKYVSASSFLYVSTEHKVPIFL
jgi:hypothetical protein